MLDRLNFLRDKRLSDEPEPKRISTPAGLRLSTVLENGDPTQTKNPESTARLSFSVLVEDPRESKDAPSSASNGYSYSISASQESPLPSPALAKGFGRKRRRTAIFGRKRLAVFGIISLLCLIAVTVGLVLGLRKKKGSSSTTAAQSNGSSTTSPSPTSTSGALATNTAVPKDFPVGSYSMVTYLDTVTTDCASNTGTWTCYPYTIYNDDHAKAEATFNWVISAGSNAGSYQISSTANQFGIDFKNAPLTLVDAGKDSERYTFHVTFDKTVNTTVDNSAATCFFNSTSFQAYLYTKRAKEYQPGETDSTLSEWPFAVRAEEVVGGGDNTPNCYKTTNGNLGDKITKGIMAQDPGNLCDCLYRNWLTGST